MSRKSIPRQGDSRWTIIAGARSLPVSADLPQARDLPARRSVRRPVRRRLDAPARICLQPLSRRQSLRDS